MMPPPEQGISFNIGDIPPGDYTGIRVGIGLNSELNSTNPGDYAAGHPLSDNYWSAATGYIFSKIEGNADLNGDNNFSEGITYHSGANEFYQEKTFNKVIRVPEGGTVELQFKVDLQRCTGKRIRRFYGFSGDAH